MKYTKLYDINFLEGHPNEFWTFFIPFFDILNQRICLSLGGTLREANPFPAPHFLASWYKVAKKLNFEIFAIRN